jgi:hypothetical protein
MVDMLLADATQQHAHDGSPSQSHPSASPALGSFLAQMPLALVSSFLRLPTAEPSRTTADAEAPDNAPGAMTIGVDVHPSASRSRSTSSGSSATADDPPKKRAPRSKTSYICARPVRPVDARTKHYLRPKVLLQLHQVIPSQRPKPTYEVIPFSILTPRSTRRLARTFNTRDRLCPNDLLVVKAEEYGSNNEVPKSDEDRWGSRDVIGVICPGKSEKDATEICMDDGTSRWEVTNMANGGFEFNNTDEHGLTLRARWVLKPVHSRRASGMSVASQLSPTFPPGQDDKRYNFSAISASSRRHPVIANMNRTRIDVMDSYTMPIATSPPTPNPSGCPQSPVQTPASIDKHSFLDEAIDQLPIQTDDALRRFIVVSGIWVAHNSYNTPCQPPILSLETPSIHHSTTNRTVSMAFPDPPRSTSPASTIERKRRSFPKMLRAGTVRLPRSTSFTALAPSPIATTPNASPTHKTRSRRANSTGNAALYSMSGSMRKRYGLAFEDNALPESEEEKQIKRSVELLRIKELVIPPHIERPSPEKPFDQSFSRSTSPAKPTPITIPHPTNTPTSTPPLLSPSLLSPPLDTDRARKTRSAYRSIETAGLWDSGITERPGLNSRPTSMFVVNEKKRKEEKKRGRGKTKDKEEKDFDNDKGHPAAKRSVGWDRMKSGVKGLFKKGKDGAKEKEKPR